MTEASVEVCRGRMADLAAIVLLERATAIAPHWNEATYAEILSVSEHEDRDNPRERPYRCLFVAHWLGRVAGYAVAALHATGTAEIESVAVETSLRGRGIGRALCGALIGWSRSAGAVEVELEVRSSSEAPIALYKSLGFIKVGRRPRYYKDPEDDAEMMRMKLD
jgi:[ribosomal protein S18]-alanine N-acetyltransferase